MPNIDFGQYETTTRTVWRQPRDRFEPSFRIDDDLRHTLAAVADVERELGFVRADEQNARKIAEITLEENVYATMRLAGREITLDEVRAVLARRPAVREPASRYEREMLNIAAFEDSLTERRVPRTLGELSTEHATLFNGVDPDAGHLRERPTFEPENGSQVAFVPAMPERIRPETHALLEWLDASDDPPVVRLAVFQYEMLSIQPFNRGNARLTRAVSKTILHRGGCEGVPYALLDLGYLRRRDDWREAFTAAGRERDLTPWIRYCAEVVRHSYEDAIRRFHLHQQADGALNERQWRVAEWFARRDQDHHGRRVRFSEVHAAFPDVPERTLQRDLATLRESGILVMEGKWKGARYVFAAEESEGEREQVASTTSGPY